MIKIKSTPEDFVVEEIMDAPLKKRGTFTIYRLVKKNQNTIELLHRLAKTLQIPFVKFSYGGRKDRHALSTQHIGISKSHIIKNIREKTYSFEFLGFLDRPMGPDLIKRNHFKITIRAIDPENTQALSNEILKVKEGGFFNYFDDQRFGSFDPRGGFLGEKILKNHFNGALKIYLTRYSSEDKKEERLRKDFFFNHWGEWAACLEKSRSGFEKMSFSHLGKKPKDFLSLLRAIPAEELSLFYSAYQASLWNKVLRRWGRRWNRFSLLVHTGCIDPYLFYDSADIRNFLPFKEYTIPLPASRIICADEIMEQVYSEVLKEHELKTPLFNITKIRQAYYKGTPRKIIVTPINLSFKFSNDETCKKYQKLYLSFSLPAGSYATMLIKRLFAKKENPDNICSI